jgi:hypothetical protein
MQKEELAKRLNGSEYPLRINKDLAQEIKESGLVVIYGASDDLMEFEGVISDELGVYDGDTIYVYSKGIFPYWDIDDVEDLDSWNEERKKAIAIEAIWDKDNISWQYKTRIPHVIFNIVEDDNIYCKGIIFEMNAVLNIDVIEKLKKF